ncbi:hypothetical protein SAMN04487786_2445 [Paenisporosarcina quisquiliarum]|nr:hypothetical protein SAMN04487786_2445 [Paenisporosarcina quisquiliarum]
MHYEYEQIDYQVDIPIKIFTHTVERFPYHCMKQQKSFSCLKANWKLGLIKITSN